MMDEDDAFIHFINRQFTHLDRPQGVEEGQKFEEWARKFINEQLKAIETSFQI